MKSLTATSSRTVRFVSDHRRWIYGGTGLLAVAAGAYVWRYGGLSKYEVDAGGKPRIGPDGKIVRRQAKVVPLGTTLPEGLSNRELEVAPDGRVEFRRPAAERMLARLANSELVWLPLPTGQAPRYGSVVRLHLVDKPDGGAARWIAEASLAGWDVGISGNTVLLQPMDVSRPPEQSIGAKTSAGVLDALLVRGGAARTFKDGVTAAPSVWPLPLLPSGVSPPYENQYVAKDLGVLTARSLFSDAAMSLREQVAAVRAIDWKRLEKIERLTSMVRFDELTPDMLAKWQENRGYYYGSVEMVAVTVPGTDPVDYPMALSVTMETRATSLLWVDRQKALRREGGVDMPVLSTMGEKFEDPWSSQGGNGKHYLGGEMDYLHDVPANAQARVAAMFEKCKNLGGRAAPSLDGALAAFDSAWEQYAKQANAKKDEYAGYVLKAAVLSGQPYLIAAATAFAAIMKIVPIQEIFGDKDKFVESSVSATIMWTAMMKSATPSNGRVLQASDVAAGDDVAQVVNSRICAQLRNTLLPKEAILPLQVFWAMTMRAVPTNTEKENPPGVPTVAAAYRALGGADVWSFLASDEQVVLVGLPIAYTYGLNGRRFCELLWEQAQGWSRWPGLLMNAHDDVRNITSPCNAWSVQWFDLILTGFDLGERALRGEIEVGA